YMGSQGVLLFLTLCGLLKSIGQGIRIYGLKSHRIWRMDSEKTRAKIFSNWRQIFLETAPKQFRKGACFLSIRPQSEIIIHLHTFLHECSRFSERGPMCDDLGVCAAT
ncbi:hypothetical protein, partial [Porphyromonas loveana]|uniref:hypothetical protein n=1 Tax=Porphyromonas loveana TaxID=1884669 RepID=UPI0035A0C484